MLSKATIAIAEPISLAITLSDLPRAKRLNSSFWRGLNITTRSPAISGGEAAFRSLEMQDPYPSFSA